MGFTKIQTQDRPSSRNVEAAVKQEAAAYGSGSQPRVARQSGAPTCVDLHNPKVFRPVLIVMDGADRAAFDELNRGQNPRRKMIERGNRDHAGQKRNCHGPVSRPSNIQPECL